MLTFKRPWLVTTFHPQEPKEAPAVWGFFVLQWQKEPRRSFDGHLQETVMGGYCVCCSILCLAVNLGDEGFKAFLAFWYSQLS